MKEQTIPQNARQDSEFSLCAVPESERKSYISLTIIWTGFIFAIISLMAGGSLAMGLSFQEIMIVSLIGNVFLCAIAASLTGLLGGNILMLICGSIATIAMNEYDLTLILLGFGLVIPSLILMTTNIFTTNAANLYSTGLNLANSFKIGRTKMMLILIGVSAAATLLKPHEADFYYTFLNALGNVIPPLAGIIVADYFVVNKGRYLPLEKSRFVAWNPIPWISWVVSVIIVFTLAAVAPRVQENIPAPFTGIVLGAVFHIILMKATKTKVNLAETEEK